MIAEAVILIAVASLAGSALWSMLTAMSMWKRNTLINMEVQHQMLESRLADTRQQVHAIIDICRIAAPDNSIRCVSETGHLGLHTDGKRWWYGKVWFPTQLEMEGDDMICGHRSKGVGFVCILEPGHSGEFHEAAMVFGGEPGPRWRRLAGDTRDTLKDKGSHEKNS